MQPPVGGARALRVAVVPRAALPPAALEAIGALCERAYEEDLRDALAGFTDAVHVLAHVDDTLVSHALWIPRPLVHHGAPVRSAYVELVATEPAHRGRGYATAVLRRLAAEIAAPAAGFDLGVLSPSDPAFYARLGWEPWRGPLAVATADGVVPTPDEEVMVLRWPHTPPLDLGGPLVAPWRPGEVW